MFKAVQQYSKPAKIHQKACKPVKRLKRNDLICEKEKQKMQHKFNKIMRKENKSECSEKGETSLDLAIKKELIIQKEYNMYENTTKKNKAQKYHQRQNPEVNTANKRAQIEYEKKIKEKELEKKVICPFSNKNH